MITYDYKPSLRNSSSRTKLHFLEACVKRVGSFRWSRWPYQKTQAKLLDQIQTHMLAILFPTAAAPGEIPNDYFRRRSLNAGRLAASQGRWGATWAAQVRSWHDHVTRGHDAGTWAKHIYKFHDSNWLTAQRLCSCRGLETSRTNTRRAHGRASRRYQEGYEEARTIPLVST